MISAPGIQILIAVLIASAMMIVLWCVQRRTHNAGIVDAGWAAAIGLLAVFFAATSGGYLPRRILVAVLGSCLGLPPLLLHTDRPRVGTSGRRTLRFTAQRVGRFRRAEAFLLLSKSGFVCSFLRTSGAGRSALRPAPLDWMGSGRHPDLGVRCRKHYSRRPSARAVPNPPGKPRQDLSCRLVAIFQASQLLF